MHGPIYITYIKYIKFSKKTVSTSVNGNYQVTTSNCWSSGQNLLLLSRHFKLYKQKKSDNSISYFPRIFQNIKLKLHFVAAETRKQKFRFQMILENFGNSISKPDINFRILKVGQGRSVQLSCCSELFSDLLQNVYYNQLLVTHPFLYPLYSAACTKTLPSKTPYSCLNTFPLFRH
jgi:hypothetical protein